MATLMFPELVWKNSSFKVVRSKKVKISIRDDIIFLYLIIIKLCTLKQLESVHQKLKLKFS